MDRAGIAGEGIEAGDGFAPGPRPLFAETTIHVVYGISIAAGAAYCLDNRLHRTALLEPIAPDLTVAAIGVGVFVGILWCAAMLSGWHQGMEVGGDPRKRGLRAAAMLVMAMAGPPVLATYCARRAVEFYEFHGVPVVTAPVTFTVVGPHRHRSRFWLEVRDGTATARLNWRSGMGCTRRRMRAIA